MRKKLSQLVTAAVYTLQCRKTDKLFTANSPLELASVIEAIVAANSGTILDLHINTAYISSKTSGSERKLFSNGPRIVRGLSRVRDNPAKKERRWTMEKSFKVVGAYGSSDLVTAKSASAARKIGESALGEPVVRVELVDPEIDANDEATEEEPSAE